MDQLRLIEDSLLCNSAVFGFDKDTSSSAVETGKGKNDLKHCGMLSCCRLVFRVV
jgi:hypothetical protein